MDTEEDYSNRTAARLTIHTPTYNRAHTLPRLYGSLKCQKCKSFIWLIVDDGSTDDTNKIVHSWIEAEKDFEIRYIYKENGGIHTAYNTAFENIDTELAVGIDSDDMVADGAIELILKFWDECKSEGYSGVVGLDADLKGNIIGDKFPDDVKNITVIEGSDGLYNQEKKFVVDSELYKTLPRCPVFEGEKYFPELTYTGFFIPNDRPLLAVNEVFCIVDYQKG